MGEELGGTDDEYEEAKRGRKKREKNRVMEQWVLVAEKPRLKD